MSDGFLSGIRVLDLSQFIPGPLTGRILADLGAEVVKIEPPAGDPMRYLSRVDGLSPEYILMNGGKVVGTIDLKTVAGKSTLIELLKTADVLIESFRPGVLSRLGWPPEKLSNDHPRLIHCAISGYGQTGPYRLKAGHDINYMAIGGGLSNSGEEAKSAIAFPPTSDYATALQAAVAILAALHGRASSGKGCFLDLSLMETVLAWQSIGLTQALQGKQERGTALLNGGAASYNIYETSDGRWLSVGIVNEKKFWNEFCECLGRPDLTERFDESLPQRELIADLKRIFVSRPLSDWTVIFQGADVCVEGILDTIEVTNHPQIVARKLVEDAGPNGEVDVKFPVLINGKTLKKRQPPRLVGIGHSVFWS